MRNARGRRGQQAVAVKAGGWRAALHGGSPRGRARAYAIGRRALPTCEGHRGAGLSAKLRPTGDPSRLLHLLSMGPQIAGGKPMITYADVAATGLAAGSGGEFVCCDVERKIGPTPPLVRLCVPCHMRGHRGGRPRIGNGSGPAAADCSHCLGCVRGSGPIGAKIVSFLGISHGVFVFVGRLPMICGRPRSRASLPGS